MQLPRLFTVRQNFPDRRIPDVAAEVQRQLRDSDFTNRLRPGARVAIGVGSRGITNIATIARALGIDPTRQNMSNVGRPIRFADVGARPIESIVG